MIDILSIEPTVISRDLKGKYLLLYGKPKTGKTTMASRFPKNLLIAFEKAIMPLMELRPLILISGQNFVRF
jgi:Holliday junction resolvasome RuvABC ATP-dependent DNA helicase subunit